MRQARPEPVRITDEAIKQQGGHKDEKDVARHSAAPGTKHVPGTRRTTEAHRVGLA
ncbi:hypothetical protein D3C87_2035170 [compost metagenome]